MSKEIFVVGHKNPDTDAICSAITYANLRKITTNKNYIPIRTGAVSPETKFVLDKFGVKSPELVEDIRVQVKDLDLPKVKSVDGKMSIKSAWEYMTTNNLPTLCVTENDRVIGIITITDIARLFMNMLQRDFISNANTPVSNITETISGRVLIGDKDKIIKNGDFIILSNDDDIKAVKDNDIVVFSDMEIYKTSVFRKKIGLAILCKNCDIKDEDKSIVEKNGTVLVKTDLDLYQVTNLLNQSIPIEYAMRKDGIVFIHNDDYVEDVAKVLKEHRFRSFPVIDSTGKFVDMLSRRHIINYRKKQVVLVDHNEKSQAINGIETAEIVEIVDHHRLGGLETDSPLMINVKPVGCSCTIVYQMYKEADVKIEKDMAGLMCSAIISDTLLFRSPTCTKFDEEACRELAKIAEIDLDKYAMDMFMAGADLLTKTDKEVFYSDFKKFEVGNTVFGAGQVTAVSDEILEQLKEKVENYFDIAMSEGNLDMGFFMLTNIFTENTIMVCRGNGAREVISKGFNVENSEYMILKKVVSRKKQLIPTISGQLK